MKIRKSIKHVLCVVTLGLAVCLVGSNGYAESRSVTFHVSCVIPATLELVPSSQLVSSSPQSSSASSFTPPQRQELGLVSEGALVSVRTNLGNNYLLGEENKVTPAGPTKLFSVTAL